MHLKPKKSLGQNFLIDKNIQHKIIACLELGPQDIILEIGAGRGELTRLIAKKANKVFALEIDRNLCAMLNENLEGASNVKIINHDILKFDLQKYFRANKHKIKVFGNIPYYISSPIIEHLLRFKDKIDAVYLTVQKEFARRLISLKGTKDYGAFSCFVQYYFEPKLLFKIKKTSFHPAPKVDSCFILLRVRPEPPVQAIDEARFFKIIRSAFGQRRKTLRNSLSDIVSAKILEDFFKIYGINRNARPEDLSLQDFANLSNLV